MTVELLVSPALTLVVCIPDTSSSLHGFEAWSGSVVVHALSVANQAAGGVVTPEGQVLALRRALPPENECVVLGLGSAGELALLFAAVESRRTRCLLLSPGTDIVPASLYERVTAHPKHAALHQAWQQCLWEAVRKAPCQVYAWEADTVMCAGETITSRLDWQGLAGILQPFSEAVEAVNTP